MYILGIGLGTLLGNCVFIFGGQLIAERISHNQNILNWVIGGIFALTAGIQLWKILKKKDAHHQMEHPEALKRAKGHVSGHHVHNRTHVGGKLNSFQAKKNTQRYT